MLRTTTFDSEINANPKMVSTFDCFYMIIMLFPFPCSWCTETTGGWPKSWGFNTMSLDFYSHQIPRFLYFWVSILVQVLLIVIVWFFILQILWSFFYLKCRLVFYKLGPLCSLNECTTRSQPLIEKKCLPLF